MNQRAYLALATASVLAACGGCNSNSTKKIEPPVKKVEVVRFTLSDFAAVAIAGSFEFEIRQGTTYTVELTVDEDVVDALDVDVDGNELQIGFVEGVDVRANTLEATVVMPAMERFVSAGSNSGTVSGFTGTNLQVDLVGNSFLEIQDVTYDYLTLHALGSTQLEFENATALPAAHVELTGSSSATVNLMDNATVTGSLFGTTALFYYGSDINMLVTKDSTSSVTRLGDTR